MFGITITRTPLADLLRRDSEWKLVSTVTMAKYLEPRSPAEGNIAQMMVPSAFRLLLRTATTITNSPFTMQTDRKRSTWDKSLAATSGLRILSAKFVTKELCTLREKTFHLSFSYLVRFVEEEAEICTKYIFFKKNKTKQKGLSHATIIGGIVHFHIKKLIWSTFLKITQTQKGKNPELILGHTEINVNRTRINCRFFIALELDEHLFLFRYRL
jgi:hypothetical protein